MAGTYETIEYQVSERILTITLNRPDKLNAFTLTMCEELIHAFEGASADDDIGAIIVTGAGRTFCAGMDLSVKGNVFGLDDSLERPAGISMSDWMIHRYCTAFAIREDASS